MWSCNADEWQGAQVASGKILLFLHADTILPQDALFRIEEALKAAWSGGRSLSHVFQLSPMALSSSRFFLTNIRSRMLNVYTGRPGVFYVGQELSGGWWLS